MTSKTFKSSRPTGTMLRVDSTEVFSEAHLTIVLHSREEDICIDPSEAPALALAILEAAGVKASDPATKQVRFGTPEHLGHIAFELKRHAEWEAKHTAEAKEQAELEAEALELLNAHRKAERFVYSAEWDDLNNDTKSKWLAVARRAREMRAEK